MFKFKKGFTLIELLVVIAIIGILSSVVLASLNTARAKGANAAVKSNLNNLRAQTEIVYDDNNGSYLSPNSVCANPQVVAAMAAAATAGGGTAGAATNDCNVAAGAWAAYSVLRSAEGTFTTWCVDSTGASKGQTAANVTTLGTTGTACI
ncbi:MAG: type II secretion system protein [Candidatus Zambryskibacteria bacterium]|nr:type II secretion system protein [Candidatus Zambryskibacteria bacterium]